MPTQIDPTIKALAQAIGQQETGASSPEAYQKKGKSGEFGRYQFMPDTYKNYAQKYLGDAKAEPSVENQNKIVYSFIEEKKKQGYNPAQIASMWNAGEGKPNAYKENYRGVNEQGVAYDTPAYVENVSKFYQQFKGQSAPIAAADAAQPEQKNSYIKDVSHDVASALQGAGEAISNPNINILSKGIQGVGALAGGVGNVLNTSIEHIPIVGGLYKGVESGVGNAVSEIANTPVGKDIADAYQSLPSELRGDIGAALNIASLVPMAKGLSLGKSALEGGVAKITGKTLEKAVEKEIRGNITTKAANAALAKAEARGIDPVKTLISNKEYLPDVVRSGDGFTYSTGKAATSLSGSLAKDEEVLQSMLKQGVKKNLGVPLEEARQTMIKDMVKKFPVGPKRANAVRAVNELFDKTIESENLGHGRSIIDLNEFNDIKRQIGDDINWNNLGVKNGAIKSAMYRSLMSQVENMAEKAGVKGVGDLNKVMAEKIEALKVLGNLEGKSARGGNSLIREASRDVAGAVGESTGNLLGIPLAGTFAGRSLAGLVSRRLPKNSITKLKKSKSLKSTSKEAALNLSKSQVMQQTGQKAQEEAKQ